MNFEDVKTNCDKIRGILEKPFKRDNGDEVAERIEEVVSISGLIAFTEACAAAIYNQKVGDVMELNKGLSPSHLKIKIAAEAWEEMQYMKIAERLGRNWSGVNDALRSILSKLKADKEKGY